MRYHLPVLAIIMAISTFGYAVPGPDSVELTRTATITGPAATPPNHLQVAVTITVEAGVNVASSLTAFTIQEVIPSGWNYVSVDASPEPAVAGPDPNSPTTLNFVWVTLPNLSSPFTMTYYLAIPTGSTGGEITGQVLYRTSGGTLSSMPVSTLQDYFNCLLMTRTAPAQYRAGDQVTVTVTVHSFCGDTSSQSLTALGVEETIPAGWTLVSVSGAGDIQSPPGTTGTLEFGWTTIPTTFPLTFSYVLSVPQDATGNVTIDGVILSRLGPSEQLTSPREQTSIALVPTSLVPNVTGQSETTARAAIESAGLIVGDTSYQCNNAIAAGTVLEQSPTAGTRLDLGSAVDLVVSSGPCLVEVPSVVGQGLSSAISTLLAAGFSIGTAIQACSDTYPSGTVIGQDPAGGSSVPYGSVINIVLSSGPCQVTVPNVVGQAQGSATSTLTAAGLVVGTVVSQCSNTVPAGNVISQNPVGGTQVNPGTAVNLVVSAGAPSVPGVTGQPEDAARAAIEAVPGLTVSVSYQCSDTTPAGQVITQTPQPGPAVCGTTVTLTVSSGPCNATVPDVVGLTREAAEAAVTAAGLIPSAQEVCNDTVPAGTVSTQNPAAGVSVTIGTTVSIAISTGAPVVPDVIGLTEATAWSLVNAVTGLSVTTTRVCSNTVEAGTVISQNPEPGPSSCGTTVTLAISTGPCNATVPDVAGLAREAAEAVITAAGLYVGTVTEQCSDTVAAGSVIGQDPVGGTEVTLGTSVDLVVSTGSCNAVVPDVVGLTQVAATTAITAAGLYVGTVTEQCSDTVAAGSVISQNPVAGTAVTEGSTVDLVVSSGPCGGQQVTVPNVVGLTQAAATTAITAAGLYVGTVTEQCSDTVSAGQVISQDPAVGASVAPGTAVNLVVSSGPCGGQQVTVPNVVNKPEADARAEIMAAGLVVGTVTTQCSDTAPAGQVISQDPVGGASVAPGTAVNLVVSAGPAVVPNVTGQAQSAATAAIEGAGLVVGTVQPVYSTTVAAGVVIRQYPAAGVTLTCGASVNLLVSQGAPDKVPTNREVMKQIHDQFKDLDTNGDGFLSLEEVLAAVPNLPIDVFDLIDADGGGQLTLDELKNYLKINGCFGCVKRLFVKDLLISAGGDLLLAGLGLSLLISALQRRNSR
ncbi:MAG: PASTA domain-containing protein [Candidatus Hydrogenedentes bacterium]|nr:PASTA domain-containing protein [Candidatus Hydrogenedentota bacterium]